MWLIMWSTELQWWYQLGACWKLIISDPTPFLLNQGVYFNKIRRWFICMLKFKKHWVIVFVICFFNCINLSTVTLDVKSARVEKYSSWTLHSCLHSANIYWARIGVRLCFGEERWLETLPLLSSSKQAKPVRQMTVVQCDRWSNRDL